MTTYHEIELWETVYVAAIRAGQNHLIAKFFADEAVKARREVVPKLIEEASKS